MATDFTICVLLYGPHTDLARRCLESIQQRLPPDAYQLRVGLNDCCPATRQYAETVHDELNSLGGDVQLYISHTNRHKYPMMTWMFHDEQSPATTPYVMWFDDDSYLIGNYVNWLGVIRDRMVVAGMLGSLYTMRLAGNQHQWVEDQPWYTGQPVASGHKVTFATGGWWVIRREILDKHAWPIPDLDHRGGDVMLGELCRQQGYVLRKFNEGVAINADAAGGESRATRRGFDSRPVGYDYVRRPEPPVLPQPQKQRRPWLEL